MKKSIMVLSLILVVGMLFGCSGGQVADYTTQEFEAALNNGEDVTGKTVAVEVLTMDPNSKLGYNMQAGQHLNFVSPENPGVKDGETVVVTVERVASMFGSYIITYKK